jgi:hypothetical protein
MAKMIATRMFNYPSGTRRRLKPGDEFVAGRDADILIALQLAKRAVESTETIPAVVKPVEPSGDATPMGLSALRERYRDLTGELPDLRFGVARLRDEIARLQYERRDLRAEGST